MIRNERLRRLTRALPRPTQERLRELAHRLVARRKPRWGNLRRSNPFSDIYGLDRGTSIGRVYIADFLREFSDDIHGEVLEVRDDRYTREFGGPQVTSSHVLDIDAHNKDATIIADLSEEDSLAHARFDCLILTQTLQYVPDVAAALRNAWQSLAPGGRLLISVPTLSRLDPSILGKTDLWRFTPVGLEKVLADACEGGDIYVRGYGNLCVSVAFLMGLAAQDLTEHEIRFNDPRFPLLACGRAAKASTNASASIDIP
jgi:SAM-dependent methyltransferase